MHRLRALAVFVCLTVCAAASSTAHAGPGIRLGVTDDPSSIFVGAFWQVPLTQLGPGELRIQPGVDFAIVDGPIDFFIKGSGHFAWEVPIGNDLRLYPLFGPVLTIVSADRGRNDDDIDIGLGVDLGVGLGVDRFLFELWLGVEDTPDITFAFGFLF